MNISIQSHLMVKGYLVILCVISLSFLRPLLFAGLPIFVLIFVLLFRAKSTISTIIILVSMLGTIILASLYQGEFNISNNFLSLYFIFPIVIILFSRIKIDDHNYFPFLIQVMTLLLICNNLIGVVQLIRNPTDDDSFIGFYGTHGLGLHTLSIVNYLVGVYYFIRYQQEHRSKYFLLSLFFIFSAILSFYGLGLIIFLLSIFVYKFSLRNLIGSIFIFAFVLISFGTVLYMFKKQTFLYNIENIKRAELFFKKDVGEEEFALIPRKLILFRNYVEGYSKDAGIFLLGSGPGTFNSRTYFLLNGDYSKSKSLENIFGTHQPKMAAKYVYPLWNTQNTGQYMDGTRNEPFSSIISLLAEYGFIIFTLIVITVYSKYSVTLSRVKQNQLNPHLAKYLKFASIFILLNLFTDNFLEYPEIMFIYLLIFKLIEISMNRERSATDTKQLIS